MYLGIVSLLACKFAYRCYLYYNQLISVHVSEVDDSDTVYNSDMDLTFIFAEQKDESVMVKCILHHE